ncbi:FAD-binding domain-containing protein [Viridothelium virens]|uniref:FAD-binding domain-containing protein n=1 Tax=Viridothelium virens TaxID=1048519 RepID=A0A6A6GV54_VIRVR|nr:FAD-binding domain-containing protein [Viridothelium virens]
MFPLFGISRSLLGFLLATRLALAQSNVTLSACKAIYAEYPSHLALDPLGPLGSETISQDSLYASTNTDYWNEGNSKNRAACAFFPGSAEEVSYAVKVLNNYTNVQYALKSGGHNPNFGFSSVNQGILISFRPNLANTTISTDHSTADVGPGSRWDEALTVLDQYGKAIVGGRLGHVGVGGYILGGGLSFLTSQYGFAADTLVNVECVTANGTIINANRTSNSDIFFAMQGGGNQFGIVTKYTLKTFDIGQVWGGTKVYAGTDHEAILAATAEFTENFTDPKAAIIVTNDFALDDLASLIVMFYFYDGPTPPAGIFDEFDKVTPISSNVSTQSYPSLLTANNAYSLSGFRYQIREGTYPNLPHDNMTAFYDYHYTSFQKQAFAYMAQSLDIQIFSFAIQPLPVALKQSSADAGGNRLGLDAANGDTIFMEYDVSWLNPTCDNLCPGYLETMVNSVKSYQQSTYGGIAPTNYKSGDISWISYNPIFPNDGMYDQQVLQSFGNSTYQQLKTIQQRQDPNGFFSQRQGGFKFST